MYLKPMFIRFMINIIEVRKNPHDAATENQNDIPWYLNAYSTPSLYPNNPNVVIVAQS